MQGEFDLKAREKILAHNTKRKQRGKILVYGRDLDFALDEPRADEAWIHALLLSWGEWCKERKVRGKCNSIEHRYVAPKGNIYNPPEPRGEPVNLLEIREVNSAMLELPEQTRNVLAARYFLKSPDYVLLRRFRIKEDSYPKFMRDARLMLQSILLKRRSECILTSTTRPRQFDETLMPDGRASLSDQKVVSS